MKKLLAKSQMNRGNYMVGEKNLLIWVSVVGLIGVLVSIGFPSVAFCMQPSRKAVVKKILGQAQKPSRGLMSSGLKPLPQALSKITVEPVVLTPSSEEVVESLASLCISNEDLLKLNDNSVGEHIEEYFLACDKAIKLVVQNQRMSGRMAGRFEAALSYVRECCTYLEGQGSSRKAIEGAWLLYDLLKDRIDTLKVVEGCEAFPCLGGRVNEIELLVGDGSGFSSNQAHGVKKLADNRSLAEFMELCGSELSEMGDCGLFAHIKEYIECCQHMISTLSTNKRNYDVCFKRIKASFCYVRWCCDYFKNLGPQVYEQVENKYNSLLSAYQVFKDASVKEV